VVENNVIAYNTVDAGGFGAGLVSWNLVRPTVRNNLIYGNKGAGVWLNDTATFQYNDVYLNTTGYEGELGTLTGTSGNLAVDPKVTGVSDDGDWMNDDWTLKSSSTLINAGDSSLTDADGTRSDIGAYGGPEGSGW
jgi:hypothetical protein